MLVGTRKGAFIYRTDASRRRWTLDGPQLLGQVFHHLVLDLGEPVSPADELHILCALSGGCQLVEPS